MVSFQLTPHPVAAVSDLDFFLSPGICPKFPYVIPDVNVQDEQSKMIKEGLSMASTRAV
jgi:hypothetical protein